MFTEFKHRYSTAVGLWSCETVVYITKSGKYGITYIIITCVYCELNKFNIMISDIIEAKKKIKMYILAL